MWMAGASGQKAIILVIFTHNHIYPLTVHIRIFRIWAKQQSRRDSPGGFIILLPVQDHETVQRRKILEW